MQTPEQIRSKISEHIPKGLIVAEHTATAHFYRHVPTNQLFRSVTTKGGILDAPHLKKWAAGLAADFAIERAGEVHVAQVNGDSEVVVNIRKAAINAHQTIFEDAGDIGTVGHGFVDDYLQQWLTTGIKPVGGIVPFVKHEDARAFAIARSAELFMDEWEVKPIASELLVCSLKYKYAGTLDSLMMVRRVVDKGNGECQNQKTIDGSTAEHQYMELSSRNPGKLKCFVCGRKVEEEFALVDWKTSNSIDKVEYAMQTSAYWQALKELTGLAPKKIYIVRLDKKMAKYEVRLVTNRAGAFRAFNQAAKIYDWMNDGTEKLIDVSARERVSLNAIDLKTEAVTFNPV